MPKSAPPSEIPPARLGATHWSSRLPAQELGRGKKGHGNTYAKRIAVLAAYAAANTDTFAGERFRRLSARRGRAEEGRLRRGPVHPDHRVAPAERPPEPRSRRAG